MCIRDRVKGMERIEEILDGVKTMGIGGHVRPDGDCVGSCMALYLYIKKWYPEIKADIYLEKPKPVFGHIACMDEVHYEAGEPREYDLFVTCDVSAPDPVSYTHLDVYKRQDPGIQESFWKS